MTRLPDDGATEFLTGFLDEIDILSLPDSVVHSARLVLADTIGVLLAASRARAVRTALGAMEFNVGPCTVFGHDRKLTPDAAALINGIGGHDTELDDLHAPSRSHPAAVVVSAAIAVSELTENCTIGQVLGALVAGYEIEVRMSKAIGPDAQYVAGFHPSSVCGSVGAAVCAGRVVGLSKEEMQYCIGLGASQSSGLLTYYDDPGHMAKSFQTGIAARNGVTAALLARAGFEASPRVFDSRYDALRPFSRDPVDPRELTRDLGERYAISGTSFKRHACCALTHSSIDALLDVLSETNVEPRSIESVVVELPNHAVSMIDGNPLWTHNIQYVLSVAAHYNRVGIEHMSAEYTTAPELSEFARKVTVVGSDRLDPGFPHRIGAAVTVRTSDDSWARELEAPKGSPEAPLSDAELEAKFTHLVAPTIGTQDAAEVWKLVFSMKLQDPVAELISEVVNRSAVAVASSVDRLHA